MRGGARPGGEDHETYDEKVVKNMDEPLNYDKLSREAREYIDNQYKENRGKPNYKMTCDICKTKNLIPKIRGMETQGLSICDICYSSDKIKRKSSRTKLDGQTISRETDFPFEDLYETFISDYHDIAALKTKRKKNNKKNKSKKRVIKSYKRNKGSKFRKKTRKRLKMVGGSIYDTELDRNTELQTQLAEVNRKLKVCEKENKRLKTQLVEAKKLQAQTNKSSRWRKSSQRDFKSDLDDTKKMLAELPGEVHKQPARKLPEGTIWLGSSEEEVLRTLGTPKSIHGGFTGNSYSYNLDPQVYIDDEIRFENGRVCEYSNYSGKLPISLHKSSSTVPHGQTTVRYHQGELDKMKKSETSHASSPSDIDYIVGQKVMYKRGGREIEATIVSYDKNMGPGEDPYVEIKFTSKGEEKIRNTTLDRISPIIEEEVDLEEI